MANTAKQREITLRIAAIDEILESGVASVRTDGTTTRIDVESLRKERRELRQQVTGTRRPLFTSIKTSGV